MKNDIVYNSSEYKILTKLAKIIKNKKHALFVRDC